MHKVKILITGGKAYCIYKDTSVQVDIINRDDGETERIPHQQEIDHISEYITSTRGTRS